MLTLIINILLIAVLVGVGVYFMFFTPKYTRATESTEGFFGGVARGSGHPDCLRTLPEGSEILDMIKIIPEQACVGINKLCDEIYQARAFIHFPLIPELRREYDNIHIDLAFKHLIVLYYVNDTDGDTFIFDKKSDYENINLASVENQNELKVIKRVTPKKGRALVFDGNRYHSSSGPTKDIRCIINFDISIK